MQQAHETPAKEQDLRLKENLSKIKNVVMVMSGKGGVGKTTVAVNLAYALSMAGKSVGILDVDLHGPNIAKMLGIEEKIFHHSEVSTKIEPIKVTERLKAMSVAFAGFRSDQPIIWRGPMKTAIIKQFLSDVCWGALDYLIIDSPPGTGDEPLSVCQFVPQAAGAIIVTTPQDVAILDASKSVRFVQEMSIPVMGIIENMSSFCCPHCRARVSLFKENGGTKVAQDLSVPFLGSVPFDIQLVAAGDEGKPFIAFLKETESAKAFYAIIDKIIQRERI
jgi:ATP-binding protein involved in chromosome partitioning